MIFTTVAGNLGRDAELKNVQGQPLLEFSVASSAKEGRGEKVTTWVKCTIWGKRGESLAQYLTKGTRVSAMGTLSVRQFTGREGKPGVSVELKVSEIELMGGGQRGGGSTEHGGGESTSGSTGGFGPVDEYGTSTDDDAIPF